MGNRILVVDDEEEIAKLLEEFLNKKGYQVITALGGQKAIEAIKRQECIDLMILDLKMPAVNGVDVLQELRRLNKQIPVIILSGSLDLRNFIDDLKKLNYNEKNILYKPVDLFELLKTIKNYLP
jgi:two-component system response regulator (stage 0 sporulation protein F)